MKVLTIMSQDDAQSGEVTALIEMPEGMHEDEVFLLWLKKTESWYKDKTRDECFESPYAWNVCETRSLESY